METWKINDHVLEHEEETDNYIADGVKVPSIKQAIKVKPSMADMYKGISADIVRRKGETDALLHKAIEEYWRNGAESDTAEFRGFKALQKQYDIVALAKAVPVMLCDGKPIMAGKLDMLALVGGRIQIVELTTVSAMSVHFKEYLAYKLNLYRPAYEQSYGTSIEGLAVLHLRGNTKRFIEVKIDDFIAREIIEGLKA